MSSSAASLHVLAVLVGERLRGETAAATIDALVIGELAARQHAAVDLVAADRR